ncbi:MAG TPA: hydroxyisourate hydrolase [Candidatus Limnocylindrales bacterium]|nr:hydroxyisourate hydrolase [Candidatus Limnocylindrales bacterium]
MAEGRTTISTHVLDLQRGLPAAGLTVTLAEVTADGTRTALQAAVTDADGRVRDLLGGGILRVGRYELTFDVASYRAAAGGDAPFFRTASVVIEVADTGRSYHVPLLLSPFGLSTYRGS